MSIQMTLLSSGPDFFSVYREHGAGRHLSLVPHLVHCKLARSSSHLTNLGRLPCADQSHEVRVRVASLDAGAATPERAR